ncbi:acyl-CoA dehydrogenase family protein [Pseudofrankia inefficax]|uniref:Acyl-CoA dehydrogenase domain-containing protein n=1 Tax=Pseudofrankia inefficax (strain DSM 45817 / CECT 9037 / DDB 130130 / EuI1c) TaxID=298654 RepID=E3JC21_PSEI1|nr:acyl-CoA dehydrogenase family protein [Pseudofrankia inefficax]ADP83477.1 acyl-CoA dehydrogenase domain-containing protein [Pseudofrankia inefficax]
MTDTVDTLTTGVDLDLAAEAAEFGRTAQRAIEAAGGDELTQTAEREPARRGDLVAPLLAGLGAWELDPRGSADELEAAAALCRAAGWWALPYPVAERLARPADLDVDALVVVADVAPAAPVAALDLRLAAVTLDGRRSLATAREPAEGPRRTAFVAGLDLTPLDQAPDGDVALGLVLSGWTLLGLLDRAMALTRTYILEREQFGQPLARFQGVQFQLTDAEVERAGVAELAGYALWSIEAGRPEALDDALALRLAAIEAADVVFRVCHQLHGAMGFCDETTLSWLSRYSQPARRLPLGRSATQDALARRLGRRGLTGIFGPNAGAR